MTNAIDQFYQSLSPVAGETAESLVWNIADDGAIADVQCFSASAIREDDDSGWLHDVHALAEEAHPAESPAWERQQAQRAARYLILRQRIELVERHGKTWVRIVKPAP